MKHIIFFLFLIVIAVTACTQQEPPCATQYVAIRQSQNIRNVRLIEAGNYTTGDTLTVPFKYTRGLEYQDGIIRSEPDTIPHAHLLLIGGHYEQIIPLEYEELTTSDTVNGEWIVTEIHNTRSDN